MALFDFLKPQKTALEDLMNRFNEDPELMLNVLQMKYEEAKAQTQNLVLVNRELEAWKVACSCIEYIDQLWLKDNDTIENPDFIGLFTAAVIEFGTASYDKNGYLLETGMITLTELIYQKNAGKFMDLTVLYTCLGMIYHQIRTQPEDELEAYYNATEAIAPVGCKHPASQIDKIRAHHFGYLCAARLNNNEHQQWHKYKLNQIAPTINWEDHFAATKWLARQYGHNI